MPIHPDLDNFQISIVAIAHSIPLHGVMSVLDEIQAVYYYDGAILGYQSAEKMSWIPSVSQCSSILAVNCIPLAEQSIY